MMLRIIIVITILTIVLLLPIIESSDDTTKTPSTSISEYCEAEDVNLEYCPLRPSILETLDHLQNEAYHVCEEDILSPCTESLTLKDKAASEKLTTTTSFPTKESTTSTTTTTEATTTTTMTIPTTTIGTTLSPTLMTSTSTSTLKPTTTTTTEEAQICPTCIDICDDDNKNLASSASKKSTSGEESSDSELAEEYEEEEEIQRTNKSLSHEKLQHNSSQSAFLPFQQCTAESKYFLITKTVFDIEIKDLLISEQNKIEEEMKHQALKKAQEKVKIEIPKAANFNNESSEENEIFPVCDEERSRCDLSEPIMTTMFTFDWKNFVIEGQQHRNQKLKVKHGGQQKHHPKHYFSNGTSSTFEDFEIPKVFADTFYPKSAHKDEMELANEFPDQFHLVKDNSNHHSNHKSMVPRGRNLVKHTQSPNTLFHQYRRVLGRIHNRLSNSRELEQGQNPFSPSLKPKIGAGTGIKKELQYGTLYHHFPYASPRHRFKRSAESFHHETQNDPNYEDEQVNNNNNMDSADEEKLVNLYGKDTFDKHRIDFGRIRNMKRMDEPIDDHGPPAHSKIPHSPYYDPTPAQLMAQRDKARLNYLHQKLQQQNQEDQYEMEHHPFHGETLQQHHPSQPLSAHSDPVTPAEIKKMLRELLERLDMMEVMEQSKPQQTERCTLNGLWLSTVTGVGIQLEPMSDHDLSLKVIDFSERNSNSNDQDNAEPLITSEWTGRAVVSTESATTISIVLQEKWINREKEPRTAVFVGQCVICSSSPTIQGTWIVFPESQTCYEEIVSKMPPKSDVMYLLR